VIARSGWLAEAHATAALLSGSVGAIDVLDRHELTGIAVPLNGPPLMTADLRSLNLVAPTTQAVGSQR
jgi:hypothetical protein